ncbi:MULTISPECIES: signal peptidase I [Rhodomicrobium]|uniref:signal peptidase I n=1 Tax=Rhodomicrobium TaxID=1068 RepID=UPI000B4BE412|nr:MULTISPECIES: signal peptidase I [Rhodomicrobium]
MSSEADVKDKDADGGSLLDTLRVIFHALILALLVRIFLYQPFNIPSGSMIPTLLVGDYLFVSKFSYGYSKYSFPWSPNLFSGRIFGSEPKRGDVAVFKLPRDNETDYIKRVIGLPGDKVQMIRGVLNINGAPVKLERIADFTGPASTCNQRRQGNIEVARFRETLPNGVSHEILDCTTNSDGDDTDVFEVPPGHYFMMGDNRDNSTDSRWSTYSGVGYVPFENLIGRADIIFFSIDENASLFAPWRWPFEIRWTRFLDLID